MSGTECLSSINLCAVRVTRLDNLGNPAAGPNNVYITDKAITLMSKPVIEAGVDKTLVGGCDCIIATYRGFDKLKRFEFEFDQGVLEPGLIEMLIGATIVNDNIGEPIGVMWPTQANCQAPAQPNVCVEAWQYGWSDDRQDAEWPYIHWIWPSTRWQISDHTLQQDFNQPKITGFSRGNSLWGAGIYHDTPGGISVNPLGGWFYATTIPTARCGYQTFPLT